MFHGLRKHLSTGIESLRSKGLVGLFLFEFTVVLVGVLTAQALQNWSRELETNRQTREAQTRLQLGFARANRIAEVWQAGLPCLRERVGAIMVSAAKGEDLAEGFASRPLFPRMPDYSEPAATNARLAEMIGDQRAGVLTEIPIRIGVIQTASFEIANRWEVFRLIDPAYGPVSTADRAAARLAGAEIISRIRLIEAALAMIKTLNEQISREDIVAFDETTEILPVRNCEEVWTRGTAYRPYETGKASRD